MTLFLGCTTGNVINMEKTAQKGNTVNVHYTGKLTTGEIFDSSQGKEPLEFEIGAGQMIPGFDKGIEGMKAGEKKTLTLKPEEAYGEWDEQRVVSVPVEQLKAQGITPEKGMTLGLNGIPVTVTDVNDTEAKIDLNHPLAGKTLIFEVELVSIN